MFTSDQVVEVGGIGQTTSSPSTTSSNSQIPPASSGDTPGSSTTQSGTPISGTFTSAPNGETIDTSRSETQSPESATQSSGITSVNPTSGSAAQTSGSPIHTLESANQTSGSSTQTQPPSQTPTSSASHRALLGPIIGGTLGGLFGLGLIISALWLFYSHKRRQQTRAHQPEPDVSDFGVDPFPYGRDAKTRRSQPIPEKLPLSPKHMQAEAKQSPDMTPPSGTTNAAMREPNTLTVPGERINQQATLGNAAGLTTDELVMELNQRIRWNDNETLPEYPGSERGGT
ncbi:hypothetical protein V5O48_006053 [Marasmius crinis-equi]|uniref:Uncharacterized protein n=1 Tax=Marasmius crinis-equi TaxID=585013 RepID=A0ABR3FL35_9AGAR